MKFLVGFDGGPSSKRALALAREQAKQDLKSHIHNVLDAKTYDQAEQAFNEQNPADA